MSSNALLAEPERYRFTAAQVLAMIDAGVLPDAEEYELLDGELRWTYPCSTRAGRSLR